MIKILSSNFKNYKKINGQKIALPIDNSNGIVEHIKDSLNDHKKIVFVASDINDSREKILSYANILFDSMKMVGIKFEEYLILDGKSKEKAFDYINNANLVFLCGGDTYKQHEFFETINLKEILTNYQGLVIGQSAGALNMAVNVFNSPEEQEKSEPIFFEGLGLTNINIEPHFIFDDSLFDENEKYQREAIIKESYNRPIYGQCDGSHIIINDDNVATICGKTYLIENGNTECICKDCNIVLINEISYCKINKPV